MSGASLAFRIFSTDSNAAKTMNKVADRAEHLGNVLAGVGKKTAILTLGVTALGAALGVVAAVGVGAMIASVAVLGAGIAGIGVAFAAQNAKVQKAFSRLAEHVTSRLRRMSTQYVPILQDLARRLGHVFDQAQPQIARSLTQLAPTTQRMVVGVQGALQGLIPAIQPVTSAAIPLLDRLAAHLPGIGAAFGRLLIRMSNATKRIVPQIKPDFDRAVDIVQGAAAQISGAVSDALSSQTANRIRLAWAPVQTAIVDGVTTAAGAVRDRAVDVGTGVVNGVKKGVKSGDWSGLGKTIGSGIAQSAHNVVSVAITIATFIGRAIEKVPWFDLADKLGKQVPTLLAGLVTGLLTFDPSSLLRGLASHWQEVLIGVLTVAFTPARWIGKLGELLGRIPLAGRLLRWALEGLDRFAKVAVKAAGKALSAIGRAILDGIREKIPQAGAEFGRLLSEIPTRLGLAGITVAEKAKDLVSGLGGAIGRGVTFVAKKIGNVIGAILNPFAKAGGWLVQKGKAVIGGLASGIASKLVGLAKTLGGLAGKVAGWVGDLGSALYNAGTRLIAGFINGIKDKIGDVKATLTELTGKLVSWKGPPAVDRMLLYGAGQMTISGYIAGLESGYPMVRSSLTGLTASLSGGAGFGTPSLTGAGAGATGSAASLETAVYRGVLRAITDAPQTGATRAQVSDALVDLLRHAIRVKGGNVQFVLGR